MEMASPCGTPGTAWYQVGRCTLGWTLLGPQEWVDTGIAASHQGSGGMGVASSWPVATVLVLLGDAAVLARACSGGVLEEATVVLWCPYPSDTPKTVLPVIFRVLDFNLDLDLCIPVLVLNSLLAQTT